MVSGGHRARVMPAEQFDSLVARRDQGSSRQRSTHPPRSDPRPSSRTVELGRFVRPHRTGDRGGIIGTG